VGLWKEGLYACMSGEMSPIASTNHYGRLKIEKNAWAQTLMGLISQHIKSALAVGSHSCRQFVATPPSNSV